MGNSEYTLQPSESRGSHALDQLALDLRWSWNHAADQLWQRLDPELWDLTHNPWVVIQTVSQERLQAVANDRAAQQLLEELLQKRAIALESPAWF